MRDYSDIVKNAKKKKNEEESKGSSSSITRYDATNAVQKAGLGKKINFDTFESDLNSLSTTINNIYGGWQTQETMVNTKGAIEAMQGRIDAYQKYQSKFGGTDISDLANAYKTTLNDWDKLSDIYGYYKNADAYNSAVQKDKFDNQFRVKTGVDADGNDTYRGLTFEEVQAKKKEYGEGSAEYDYLSNYTGYTSSADFEKALASLKEEEKKSKEEKTNQGKASTYLEGGSTLLSQPYGAMNQVKTANGSAITYNGEKDNPYAKKLEEAKRIYELDHAGESYHYIKDEEGFEENSKYVPTEPKKDFFGKTYYDNAVYEYINNPDRRVDIDMYTNSNSAMYTGVVQPTSYQSANYDQMTEEEIAIYNALYKKDPKEASAYLEDIAMMLDKRATDEMTGDISSMMDESAFASVVLSLTSPLMSIAGGMQDMGGVLASTLVGADYNPYDPTHGITNMKNAIRDKRGEQLAEGGVELPVIGNLNSFLYNTGMSMADSLLGIATMGKFYTPLMGMTSYQQTASELTEQGASQDEIFWTSLVSGVAEAGFEYIGVDNLLKIKNSDSLKEVLKNALKQAGAEGFEEVGTEATNILAEQIIRGDSSDLVKKYDELIARGFSEKEASVEIAKELGGRLAQAGIGGMLSGATMGGGYGTMQYNSLKSTGQQIRENNRVDDLIDLTNPEYGLTKSESDLYNLYGEYASKGINAENISDAQIGNIYTTAYSEARDVYDSMIEKRGKNAVPETDVETDAISTLKGLTKLETAKSKINSSGEAVDIKGVKVVDGERVIITDKGEFSEGDVTLSQYDSSALKYAELNAYTENMSEAKAKLFIEQYDGKSNIEDYANSFNLAYMYGKTGRNEKVAMEHKGTLTDEQALKIYTASFSNYVKAKQTPIMDVNAKHQNKDFEAGTVDDSAIDYDNEGKGEINWNDLKDSEQKHIAFSKGYANVFGANVKFYVSEANADGKYEGDNGYYDPLTNTVYIDVHAGRMNTSDSDSYIIQTMSHEITHWAEHKAPESFVKLRDHVLDTLAKKEKVSVQKLIESEKIRLQADQKSRKEKVTEISDELAMSELVAQACEQMLGDSKFSEEMLSVLSESEQKTFIEKVKSTIKNFLDWVNEVLSKLKPMSDEAKLLKEQKKAYEKALKLWEEMQVQAIQTNQSMKAEGMTDLDLDIMGYEGLMFNRRLADSSHMENISKNYSADASVDSETLTERYNEILRIWDKLGGELNSKFLEEWDSMVGKDRNFTIFKAQAGYDYNVELSSMCKKGIPLFEAIDTIVRKEVLKELKTDTIGKAEKEILYDILKNHKFDIPCAICYVEQARQKEGAIIDAFLNGKDGDKNGKGLKLGWNNVLREVQKEMEANGVDYTFPSVDRNISTEAYEPLTIEMDEETQNAFHNALKKIANEEIRRYNKVEDKKRRLVNEVTPEGIKKVFGGTLPSNLKIFKVLFNNPNSRFLIENDLLYSSATTRNLAKAHHDLYSLFNSQGGVSGYKTKQGTVVYWGDILNKKWDADKLRSKGGVRNQSNSDFMMYTLLDHAQMYIDFTAKGYYLQAYTKVLPELKLFGLSDGKINASFIPRVHEYKNADGTVDVARTMENAGLDENGNLLFDDIEGVPHEEAFMLIEDENYSKSLCGVCIGYSDKHITRLLDDSRIQLIIGFHDKTNDGSKRYRGARYAKNYNGINEASKKSDGSTVHIGFNQFVKKAEDKFKYDDKSGSYGKETIEYNGKTYSANDIPRLATDLYLEHCEKKGLYPAYSQGETDFSKHPNYYKLLADFGLYDSLGNYAPHKRVAYNMPSEVPYLNEYGNKAYMKTEDYIKAELQKELKVRDDIALALADESEEGIIPQFKKAVNELHSEVGTVKHSSRRDLDKAYMDAVNKGDMETAQKMVDDTAKEAGYTIRAYHGTNALFNVFDAGKLGEKNFLADSAYKGFFASKSKETAENYTGLNNADMVFLSDASREELERIKAKHNFDKADKEYKEAREKFEDEYRTAHGYKEAVTDYIDRISEHAEMLGLNESAIRDLKMSWEYRWNSADSGDGRNNISRMAIEFSETKEAKEYEAFNQKIYDEWEQSELDRRGYKPNIKNLYLKIENPLVHDFDSNGRDESFSDLIDEAKKNGNDGCIFKNVQDGGDFDDIYVVFDNTQLKSADAVTYDDNGNVIPLTERFESSNEDIRYSSRNKVTREWALKHAQERVDSYKDRMEKRAKIDSITDKALILNKWLKEDSKDYHIPDIMKPSVIKLLDAIDFSSKQLLGMYGTADKKFTETKNDIKLREALAEVYEKASELSNIDKASQMEESVMIKLDMPDFLIDELRELSKKANILASVSDDNVYVLNKMTLEELKSLDEVITMLKRIIQTSNKSFTIGKNAEISALGNEWIYHLGMLKDKKMNNLATNFLEYDNATPYYVFKRMGRLDLFYSLLDGQEKLAMLEDEIEVFAKGTKDKEGVFTSEESREWSQHINEFEILDTRKSADGSPVYKTIQMTDAQVMSLYALSKRESALEHLFAGGIRIKDIKVKGKANKIVDAKGSTISKSELENIINSLSDRQKEVADQLQHYMSTRCADWGNEVTYKRWGIKQFKEQFYFPMETIAKDKNFDNLDRNENSIYRLLNLSFTKKLTPNANNQLVIDNIFDVFVSHTTEMAKYNSLALPMLDAIKLLGYSYKQYTNEDTKEHNTESVVSSLRGAFGDGGVDYLVNLLKDMNGAEVSPRGETIPKMLMSNYKISAVGNNIRVAMLQGTAYVKAGLNIESKYLMKGLGTSGIEGSKKAMKHSGLALWKSKGHYDFNIARSVASRIKQDDTWVDKAKEKSLWLAGKADAITWGHLWNACEFWVLDNTNLKRTDEGFNKAVSHKFRELIVSTQVVDSTLTRSQLMRSKSAMVQTLTAFMSEGTMTYNILSDAFFEWSLDARQEGKSYKSTVGKHGRRFARTAFVFALTNVVASLVGALPDAFRDDDDDEEFGGKYINALLENLKDSMNPIGTLPLVKDLISISKGYSPTRFDEQSFVTLANAWRKWIKVFEGEGNVYQASYKTLQGLSQLSGMPMANAWRDVVAMWNTTIGEAYPSLKIK